jgi:hypothetical protein
MFPKEVEDPWWPLVAPIPMEFDTLVPRYDNEDGKRGPVAIHLGESR